MPLDTRRINGPESSSSYTDFAETSRKCSKLGRLDLNERKQDHRPLFLKTGIITKAKGSAYIEQGQTKAICAVYGPREIPRRSDFSMRGILNCTLEHAPYAQSRRKPPSSSSSGAPNQDLNEEEMSVSLGKAIEATVCMHLYPKSQIDVYVTVLEDDGCTLAAALTVAGLALADASIQMFDTLIGASLIRKSGVVLIDPTQSEIQSFKISSDENPEGADISTGQITIGYQPSLEQVALMTQEGNTSTDHLLEDTRALTKTCSDIVPNVQLCLVESVKSSKEELY